MHPSRMRTICSLPYGGWSLSGGSLCVWGGSLSGRPPPPVNRMTDRCKNITLPQTLFVSGNKYTTQKLRI